MFHSRCDLLEEFTTEFQDSYFMEKEIRDKLEAIEMCFEGDTMYWDSFTRRPYYRMRGKKVTEEQAAQIIESINRIVNERGEKEYYLINLERPVSPAGTVGVNDIMSKYPNNNEIIQDVLNLILRFPFLDFMAAVSDWDEIPPGSWKNDFHEYEYIGETLYEYKDFSENLELGIWVHDNKIEFLNENNAKKKYNEYDKLYSDQDLHKYIIFPSWAKRKD